MSGTSSNLPENCICGSCGGTMVFDPSSAALSCGYCGAKKTIEEKIPEFIMELDLASYLLHKEDLAAKLSISQVVDCKKCGAEIILEQQLKVFTCPYCSTPLVSSHVHTERLVAPSYMLPFKISSDGITEIMKVWIKKRWFTPGKLKKQAIHTDQIKGIYIPFWTFDADTYTTYQGSRGDVYYVTTGTGENKKTVRKVRWTFVSGAVSIFFNDLMHPGSKTIPEQKMRKLNDYDMSKFIHVNRSFQAGFVTEKYIVSYQEAFDSTKDIMKTRIKQRVRDDIGGNYQKILSYNVHFSDLGFKLILLPIYISSYIYKNKLYNIYINGTTGTTAGDRPYSAFKIFLFVLTITIIVILVIVAAVKQ